MSTKQIPITQKSIFTDFGNYKKAMETDMFVFFVNFNEGDENAQVIMYKKVPGYLELVSDNYFASTGLMEEFRLGSEIWMSIRMNRERHLQIVEFTPLMKELIELIVNDNLGEKFMKIKEELQEYFVALPENNILEFLRNKFDLD